MTTITDALFKDSQYETRMDTAGLGGLNKSGAPELVRLKNAQAARLIEAVAQQRFGLMINTFSPGEHMLADAYRNLEVKGIISEEKGRSAYLDDNAAIKKLADHVDLTRYTLPRSRTRP